MTWSYSGDPSASDKDMVRFLTGDTDTTDQLVTNEEITATIAVEGGMVNAAVAICQAVAAKFSRKADKQVGKLRISLSQKAEAYLKLADRLAAKGNILAAPYAGGLLISEKDTVEDDESAVQPSFTRGMMTNE